MLLPTGTVTFVFTDIEGSTRLLKQLGDSEYATLLAVHRRLVREIFTAHEGQEIDTQGDAFFYSFVRARQAVAAAIEAQRAHAKATWPGGLSVRVRLGLHTGEPAVGDEGYTGLDVVRASRIAAAGGGGQVLVSDATRSIVSGDLPDGVTIRSLGERQLKDIDRPEPIFELHIDDLSSETDAAEASGATIETPKPKATELDDFDPDLAGPIEAMVDNARQRIESRVLEQLGRVLGPGFGGNAAAPPPTPPPPRRPGSVTHEIARLKELKEDGALTDDQYRRAVDRLLEGDDPAN
ncbi:MAG TPA: adenylate/guanylate cyclase domain-containing protein [Candidatus Limnocylindria bacterium]|nr:adenylate/guanylate cyclase domain-containing protein [Candidatus Limnocylindria bacterium]